mmetsp:Transcript_56886/g.158359  ORF Transcript_56886/g.158359 Transcript_56886/m.158359 type:complete len:292 (-) Transcript_56886:431-1306(-)
MVAPSVTPASGKPTTKEPAHTSIAAMRSHGLKSRPVSPVISQISPATHSRSCPESAPTTNTTPTSRGTASPSQPLAHQHSTYLPRSASTTRPSDLLPQPSCCQVVTSGSDTGVPSALVAGMPGAMEAFRPQRAAASTAPSPGDRPRPSGMPTSQGEPRKHCAAARPQISFISSASSPPKAVSGGAPSSGESPLPEETPATYTCPPAASPAAAVGRWSPGERSCFCHGPSSPAEVSVSRNMSVWPSSPVTSSSTGTSWPLTSSASASGQGTPVEPVTSRSSSAPGSDNTTRP